MAREQVTRSFSRTHVLSVAVSGRHNVHCHFAPSAWGSVTSCLTAPAAAERSTGWLLRPCRKPPTAMADAVVVSEQPGSVVRHFYHRIHDSGWKSCPAASNRHRIKLPVTPDVRKSVQRLSPQSEG